MPARPGGWADVAGSHDAAARLSQGLPGVGDIERYVSACRALGYQHPDLTAHAAQVREWYTNEDGMNLVALETDCAALQAASAAIEGVLARQDAQRVTLAAAWQGTGARATGAFLAEHGASSGVTAAAVRSAAHTLGDLRDRLWQAVDGKVATVLAIDAAAQARRDDWLMAAETVTTGAGDRATASELVDQEVKPFVDNTIGGQWLSAMRDAVEAIEAAYDAATAELASQSAPAFEVPGELGPTWAPAAAAGAGSSGVAAMPGIPAVVGSAAPPSDAAPTVTTAPVYPAGASSPAAPAVSSAAPQWMPTPPLPTDTAGGAGTAPPMPSLGGGGLPDIGSGLSSFGQQLGDLFGGLIGDAELGRPGLGDPTDVDEIEEIDDRLEEPVDMLDDDPESELDEDPESEVDDEPENDEGDEAQEEPVDAAATETCTPEPPPASPVDVPPEEPAAVLPSEPAEQQPAPAEPPAVTPEPLAVPPEPLAEPEAGTPCEIAADELPQVGE
ncbi:hypothetical protein K3G64_03525 [Mycobacterium sp. IDR2000157661]|nr:hypothetical protein K3G64_03525 [Mycobacterium sp. IDR2000157661]